jgi:hypothetical protein
LKMTAEQMTLIGVKHSEQLHHCWYCDSVWRTGTDGGKDIIGKVNGRFIPAARFSR